MDKCPLHGIQMPFDERFYADPYTTYAAMNGAGRVHQVCMDDRPPEWVITRYEDVRELLRDQRLARNWRHARPDYPREQIPEILHAGNWLTEDPPEHTRLRRFIKYRFTPKRAELRRPRIQQLVDELLDALTGHNHGMVDLMDAFASPLSITVMGELLGVPPDAQADFRTWTDETIAGSPEVSRQGAQSLLSFFVELIEAKRAQPGDDLISYWIGVRDEDGQPLSEQELVGMPFFLFLAGQDTTVGAIGNGALALITHPDKRKELIADPDRYPAAVEELMRWDGSALRGWRRWAAEDITIDGTTIPAGDCVNLSIAAAQRDPRRFPNPDEINFDRPDRQHLGFGRGPHACPGSELARIEMWVALQSLFERFPETELAVPYENLRWRESTFLRMLTALPVVLG